jgi:type IV pilus assembly protein PilO
VNDVINDFLNRPRSQRIGILAGLIVFLLIVGYFYLYLPGADQVARLSEEIGNVESDRNRKRAIASNLPRLQRELQDWSLKLKTAAAQLPDKKEIPDLLSSLSAKARESGLEIILFRPRTENYQDFYAEIPVDIVVRGTFHNAVSFFDSVEKLYRPVNMDNIGLKNSKTVGDRVELEISTLATTYRFLDEAERKKGAEEKAKAKK